MHTKRLNVTLRAVRLGFFAAFFSCSSPTDPVDNSIFYEIDFEAEGIENWQTGFADYPVGEEDFYELSSGIFPLPISDSLPLRGLVISGNNHSDDLFMFIKRSFSTLPNTTYKFSFNAIIATNAPSDCAGVGGPPGTGVYFKAGASLAEPVPVVSDGFYLMNIDKGNQSQGGEDAVVLGHIGNSKTCPDSTYELKLLSDIDTPTDVIEITSDTNGRIWVLFGTDSAFEGETTLYFVAVAIEIIEV